MNNLEIHIITHSQDLPPLDETDIFHSRTLFAIIEQTPGMWPYMAVATDESGHVRAHLLATLRRRGSMMPPYLFTQAHIYGEGVYAHEAEKADLFHQLITALTHYLHRKLCLYIEISDITKKMFGYRSLRQNGYFPVQWMQIHNSLHSKHPQERLSDRTAHNILRGERAGLSVREAQTEEEVKAYYKVLRTYYSTKLHRYIPKEQLFIQLLHHERAKIYITLMKGRIIGGATVVESKGDAYLWYIAAQHTRHPMAHPLSGTVWQVLNDSYDQGLRHVFFLNVGLPFRRNPYREFILGFGGKPISGYRWFHFTIGWLNHFLSWFYRE